MTKEEYLKIAGDRYDEIQALNKLDDFYDYEVGFVNIWKSLGLQVMESNLGTLSEDKRKKKPYNPGLHHNK